MEIKDLERRVKVLESEVEKAKDQLAILYPLAAEKYVSDLSKKKNEVFITTSAIYTGKDDELVYGVAHIVFPDGDRLVTAPRLERFPERKLPNEYDTTAMSILAAIRMSLDMILQISNPVRIFISIADVYTLEALGIKAVAFEGEMPISNYIKEKVELFNSDYMNDSISIEDVVAVDGAINRYSYGYSILDNI